MRRIFACFIALFCAAHDAGAATRDAQLTNTTGYNYNYMYPYMNNQMRTNLNPGVTTSQSLSPINTVVKTTKMGADRRVVPRPQPASRTATTTQRRTTQQITPARAARVGVMPSANTTGRRVVARSGVSGTTARARSTTKRTNNNETYYNNQKKYYSESSERMSSARCLADYTKCMNGYCERANTAYNRCYCSSKLSQIDAKYQNKIDSLITQILTLKSANQWSDSEMNEYWMDNVGKYYGNNSWSNIDSALSGINWTDLDSRVRGQNAFATGHQYCSQHLTGCYYMATNLRDAYRSEISRDCATYEQYLYTIQSAAESIVESYK
ncbi:MAG: hypothetical protein R8M71_00070 [Alphaproteobacteria bacterium]|nr:hypothetical protein [Alphaproteobacteria bacterium]